MTDLFKTDVNNPIKSIIMDFKYPGQPLLIAFGGIAGALEMPPFEFFQIAKNLMINKVFIRDIKQSWYHDGLPGISGNIDETVTYLKELILNHNVGKVVIFGNSMGGYAAILFGILIHADSVHAFAPQTFLCDPTYIRHKNIIHHILETHDSQYFDLNNLLSASESHVVISIYYDPCDRIDNRHAEHVRQHDNVKLLPYEGRGHSIIKSLRDCGELNSILKDSLCADKKEELIGIRKGLGLFVKLFNKLSRQHNKYV